MLNKKGCLYISQKRYKELYRDCPCHECIVKFKCRMRFKNCNDFKLFLMGNLVTITEEARKIKDCYLTTEEFNQLENYKRMRGARG